ncbi:MAG: ATP-binding protein [Alphaproteobacteria bacterium]|nr:ATP-binding protein [Alphaproteobacteria bacterium]
MAAAPRRAAGDAAVSLLVIFRGLPGSGKSTLAAALAKAEGMALVRADTIEQAMRDSDYAPADIGPLGYLAAAATARENLKLGLGVVADSVNPLRITHEMWRQAARDAGAPFLDIEVVCSDRSEHRRRVETRLIDVPGLARVSWAEVEAREYEKGEVDLRIDTAGRPLEDCLRALLRVVRERAR